MNNNKGFTLMEVLIAMMLLTGAIVALSSSWSGSMMAYRRGRQVDIVINLLQQKMTEKELEFKENPPPDELEEVGDFGSDFPNMSWKLVVKNKEFPDLSSILINEGDGADQMSLMIVGKMTDYMSQAVKEMQVSVLWNTRDKIQDYSVTTYLVDYNTPFSLL